MKRVLLGMSGGVDSTLAVPLLQKMGYEVEGAVLRMHRYTEVDAAAESARELGISFRVISCEEAFERFVVSDFAREYRSGRTPNPCIVCNPNVKFRVLYDEAMREGFDCIATGHYASLKRHGGRLAVAQGEDAQKDQSYMLYRLDQDILSRLILPLASVSKDTVRQMAADLRLSAADRADSQELCFVRGEAYTEYLDRNFGREEQGWFVDESGKRLGMHAGISHYTVGQRKGLGISATSRIFVKKMDPVTGNIVLSDQPLAEFDTFRLARVVYQGAAPESIAGKYDIMLRYRAALVTGEAVPEGEHLRVKLDRQVRAITPGQSAVFYRNGVVMFGGMIV